MQRVSRLPMQLLALATAGSAGAYGYCIGRDNENNSKYRNPFAFWRTVEAEAPPVTQVTQVQTSDPAVALSQSFLDMRGLYLWGSNALGVVDPMRPDCKQFKDPHDASSFLQASDGLRSVSLGRAHAAAVDAKGNLLQWGAYVVDKDALNHLPDVAHSVPGKAYDSKYKFPAHQPQCTLKGRSLKQAVCAKRYVYALQSNGTLFRLEANKERQQEQEGLAVLRLPKSRLFERIESIDAGENTLVALTNHGRVFTWIESEERPTTFELQEVIGVEDRIKQIAAGQNHFLALSDSGRVFGWGSNRFGQLGLQIEYSWETEQEKVVELTSTLFGKSSSRTETSARVTQIAAHGFTSYFVVESDQQTDVLATGHGQWGQLGTGMNKQMTTEPRLVKSVSGKVEFDEQSNQVQPLRIRRLVPGYTHIWGVLDNRMAKQGDYGYDVMAWGSNFSGECLQKPGVIGVPSVVEYRSQNEASEAQRLQVNVRASEPKSTSWWGLFNFASQSKSKLPLCDLACGECTTAIYSSAA